MTVGRPGIAGRRGEVRHPDRVVWINGELRRGAEAMLNLFDRGARDGEGLFETLAVHGGVPAHWERHLERMVLAAAELGFPVPPSPSVLREALDHVLEANQLKDAAARITVTRGVAGGRPVRTGAWIEAERLEARLWPGTRAGAAKAMVSNRAFEPGSLGPYKTTSRLPWHLAREEARIARADEALLVAADGEVLEGAVSNVFAVIAGEVRTPPLARGILPGITRARVLALARELRIPLAEARLDLRELRDADEAFVTNSLQGVVPLASLDGRMFPAQTIGDRLREAYRRDLSGR